MKEECFHIKFVNINFTTFRLSLSPMLYYYYLSVPPCCAPFSIFQSYLKYLTVVLSVLSCFAPFSINMFCSFQYHPVLLHLASSHALLVSPWSLLLVSPCFTPSSILLCSLSISLLAPLSIILCSFSIALFCSFQYHSVLLPPFSITKL